NALRRRPLGRCRQFTLYPAHSPDDAALFFVAMSFVDMSSVIPSLVGHLTQSPVLIGVLGSVQTGCWLLPQIFAARIVPGKRRKLPMVLIATTISRLGWAILLIALIFYQQIGPLVTVAACYLAVGTFTMFDGISALAWYDLIARAIPPTIRGRLFGAMSLIGGVLGIGGGLIVERIIGNPLLPFPSDYRTLVAVTLLILAVGITPLALVVEPEGEEAHPPEPLGAYLRRLPGLLRDRPSFRRLVGVQLLVGTSGLAVPFYAPFAVIGLGVPESVVGTFVIGVTAGLMVGGAAWGYLGDHGQKHRAIRAIAACGFLAPIIPL
ncbi:MAG: hypothetical protein M1335_03335, partial [Chloroflexi bacterium]|nr:hypothetical protein [Chloroflexota bacterium]